MNSEWGCSLRNLKKAPKRYPDPVLWVWLELFFTLKGYLYEKNTLSSVLIFELNTLEGAINLKLNHCRPFEAEHQEV